MGPPPTARCRPEYRRPVAGPTAGAGANRAERERWNDDQWTAAWPDREPLTDAATPALLQVADLQPGERVLDVGCGGGRSALEAARAVGETGSVVGADLSEALLELARARADAAGATHVTFALADAQTDRITGALFDVVVSQFGVMFFDRPDRAFANIRSHLVPGGRLVFACWQGVESNPWHTGTVLRAFAPPPRPAMGGDGSQPGPFSLGDPDRTMAMLERAGFVGVAYRNHALTLEVPARAVFGAGQLADLGVPPERTAEARAAVDGLLARFRIGPDRYSLPLAFRVVSAANP